MAAARVVVDLDEEEDYGALPSLRAGSLAADVIELSDTEEDAVLLADGAGSSFPAETSGASANSPVELCDDDLGRPERSSYAAGSCSLCQRASVQGPYELSECRHTFCEQCLRSYVERKLRRVLASDVNCPLCCKQVPSPTGAARARPGHGDARALGRGGARA